MLERFTKDARGIATGASEVAWRQGSPTVEAEHVLLALAAGDGVAATVLAGAGLDPDGVAAALEAEREQSLAAVGVAAGGLDLPPLPGTGTGNVRWSTSAKTALEGALVAARDRGDKRIEAAHILLALLAAREGTVPRALRGADVDAEDLALSTHAALDAA